MNETRERILREAAFSPSAIQYHILGPAITMVVTIVGIPIAVVAAPLLGWYYRRYYQALRMVLTSRELKVFRGVWMREEKTIPLEKITDLRVYQGPIMRRMGLKGLAVETAGQSNQQGALVTVIGIEDTEGFRDAALNQRDRIADQYDEGQAAAAPTPQPPDSAVVDTLIDIRDTLNRIEASLTRGDRAPTA